MATISTISGEEYTIVMNERAELQKKLEAAAEDSDFLTAHYTRLLSACEKSYQRATNANIILERKERRKTIKEKNEARRAKKKAQNA